MKIGVICYPTHGGSGVIATEIGHAMAMKGHQVHLFSYESPFRFQPFQENFHFHEVHVSAYPLFRYPPYDLALANAIMEVTESIGLEILHAHYAIPHTMSAYLAKEMLGQQGRDLKIITTLHGTDVTIVGKERGYRRVTRFGIQQSDAVSVVSEELRGRSAELFQCPPEALKVIPNFIDTKRFHPDCCPNKRATLAFADEKIVMHLSNFRKVKRPFDLVKAFAQVVKRLKARLIFLGDGPLLRPCKELAQELGVGDRVRFLGTIDTPWELLPQADLFALPSEYESFGLAALEAMSCGVPVVASDVGGIPEVVKHGETGLLYPLGNIEALAQAIEQILRSQDLRDSLGAAARKRSEQTFAKDILLPRWETFYQEVLADKGQ